MRACRWLASVVATMANGPILPSAATKTSSSTTLGERITALGGVVVLLVVIIAGHRMIGSENNVSTFTDGIGSFGNVFDPARERTEDDLRSHKEQGEVAPTPDGDGYPVQIDLTKGTARFKKS